MRVTQTATSPSAANTLFHNFIWRSKPNFHVRNSRKIRNAIVAQRAGAIPLPIRQGGSTQMRAVVSKSAENIHNPIPKCGDNSNEFGLRKDHVPPSPHRVNM